MGHESIIPGLISPSFVTVLIDILVVKPGNIISWLGDQKFRCSAKSEKIKKIKRQNVTTIIRINSLTVASPRETELCGVNIHFRIFEWFCLKQQIKNVFLSAKIATR